MKSGEAQELLARGLPGPMAAAVRQRFAALARRLGEWPRMVMNAASISGLCGCSSSGPPAADQRR
jgi:hypothetical protein